MIYLLIAFIAAVNILVLAACKAAADADRMNHLEKS